MPPWPSSNKNMLVNMPTDATVLTVGLCLLRSLGATAVFLSIQALPRLPCGLSCDSTARESVSLPLGYLSCAMQRLPPQTFLLPRCGARSLPGGSCWVGGVALCVCMAQVSASTSLGSCLYPLASSSALSLMRAQAPPQPLLTCKDPTFE